MSYTMEDFKRDVFREAFANLTSEERRRVLEQLPPGERRKLLETLPLDERLADVPAEQIREYLERLSAKRPAPTSKARRKR